MKVSIPSLAYVCEQFGNALTIYNHSITRTTFGRAVDKWGRSGICWCRARRGYVAFHCKLEVGFVCRQLRSHSRPCQRAGRDLSR